MPSRVRPRRTTPRRRTAPRWTREEWETATLVLWTRDHGRCPVCPHLIGTEAHRHHRLRRRDGGDRYANLLLLHPDCHRYITEHPDEAYANGWSVRVGQDPADVPVLFRGSLDPLWYLSDDGTRSVLPNL